MSIKEITENKRKDISTKNLKGKKVTLANGKVYSIIAVFNSIFFL